jgi:hypothetical protein
MSEYQPDRWQVLKCNYNGDIIDKVFAGWVGGYLDGNSWKLSSGITETKEFDDRYEFLNYSGSIYICYKDQEGMTGYQYGVYLNFQEQLKDKENCSMEIIKYNKE